MTKEETSLSDQIQSVRRGFIYRPEFILGIIVFSTLAALLEGIGLSFILPIVKIAQGATGAGNDPGGIMKIFLQVYSFFDIPLTLGHMILGVSFVITCRYASTFLVKWMASALVKDYERFLKNNAIENALNAKVSYFDSKGSDDILNTIITETRYSGEIIKEIIQLFQMSLLSLMYLGIALFLAPWLTLLSLISIGGITYLLRGVIEPGYTVGERVANANERLQTVIQEGMQGIRDVKIFGMSDRIYARHQKAVDQYTDSSITLQRNKEGIRYAYEWLVAINLFVLIFIGVEYFSLSLSILGVFLFAMFQLAPRASQINRLQYSIKGDLPHLVRTQGFIDDLASHRESVKGTREIPEKIERIEFKDVSFGYEANSDPILQDINFAVDNGDFVAFVGQSGAGKSTIVSLFSRFYEPDSGSICADGIPISEFDIHEWREKVAMVRQDPHIFNNTLWHNLTIGVSDPSEENVEHVAKLARIDEFLPDLANGYETELGDDGVQLSGGQRQRVSLARALLTDAEFLVLDEATSDMDSNLEHEIHEALKQLEGEYTIIAIAHRLSSIQNSDRILTVESGRIIESGTHEELLAQGGKYSELYKLQSNQSVRGKGV